MQAVLGEPDALPEVALQSVRSRSWWIGIGVGAAEEPLGDTARDSRGPAFWHAREAVTQAKRRPWGVAVSGSPERVARDMDAALALLVSVASRRTERAWKVLDRLAAGATQAEAAEALGVSRQAVGQTVRRAGWSEELLGRELLTRLARDAV